MGACFSKKKKQQKRVAKNRLLEQQRFKMFLQQNSCRIEEESGWPLGKKSEMNRKNVTAIVNKEAEEHETDGTRLPDLESETARRDNQEIEDQCTLFITCREELEKTREMNVTSELNFTKDMNFTKDRTVTSKHLPGIPILTGSTVHLNQLSKLSPSLVALNL